MSQLLPVSTAEQIRSPAITFSSLPVEIRISVWEFVSLLPRNLDIWGRLLGTLENQLPEKRIPAAPFKYLTTRPVPAILHINRESRSIGLKYYSLEFGWEMKDENLGLEMKIDPRIYYNPYADRICLMGPFYDPLQEQGSVNGSLPWSLLFPGNDQSSLAPSSFAVNLWLHECSYGFDAYSPDRHIPDEFSFIIALQKVKEVLLFWEPGLVIDKGDYLLVTGNFDFADVSTDNTERETRERLEVGRELLEREFRERTDALGSGLVLGYITQAEFEERLADLKARPVVRFVKLMGGEISTDLGVLWLSDLLTE